MKLGVLTSHPIQYQAPIFRALAERVDLTVFFAHRQSAEGQGRAGYGVAFDWDVDLLSGYRHLDLVNVSAAPDTGRFAGCDTPDIGARLQAEGIDVLLVTGWNLKSHWQAIWACRRLGIPVMVRGDSHLDTPRGRLTSLVKAVLYPVLLRCFDALLYVGARNRAYLRHYHVPEPRLFFSPHCVDNAGFAAAAAAAGRGLREQLGLTEDTRVVAYAGKLAAGKHVDDLLRAVARLRVLRPELNVTVLVAGDGPERTALTALADELSVPRRWLGFCNQSRLPAVYAAADLLALPSVSETWGLVVNEAMACGLPCVVSAVCGCAPDLIVPGVTGETHAPADVESLAQALARCLDHPADAAAIRAHIARYAPAETAGGVLAAARWLLQEKKK